MGCVPTARAPVRPLSVTATALPVPPKPETATDDGYGLAGPAWPGDAVAGTVMVAGLLKVVGPSAAAGDAVPMTSPPETTRARALRAGSHRLRGVALEVTDGT